MLWSDKAPSGHNEYVALVKVIYFWYLLDTLKVRKEIVPRLARQMLAYQFMHWKEALAALYKVTKANEADQPDWLAVMEPGHMDWIDPGKPAKGWWPW